MDETTQRAGQSWTQFLIIGILYGGLLWYQFQYVLVKKVTMPALAIFVGAAVILAIIALAWTHHVPAAGRAVLLNLPASIWGRMLLILQRAAAQ